MAPRCQQVKWVAFELPAKYQSCDSDLDLFNRAQSTGPSPAPNPTCRSGLGRSGDHSRGWSGESLWFRSQTDVLDNPVSLPTLFACAMFDNQSKWFTRIFLSKDNSFNIILAKALNGAQLKPWGKDIKQKMKWVTTASCLIASLAADTISAWHSYTVETVCLEIPLRSLHVNLLCHRASPLAALGRTCSTNECVPFVYFKAHTWHASSGHVIFLPILKWCNKKYKVWYLKYPGAKKRLVTEMVVTGTPATKGRLLPLSERAHTLTHSTSFYVLLKNKSIN